MPKTNMTSAQVADLAERYLEKHQPADYRIIIKRNGLSEDDQGWWEIPVSLTKKDVPSYDWTGRLAEAAVDLDEAEGVHVVFM